MAAGPGSLLIVDYCHADPRPGSHDLRLRADAPPQMGMRLGWCTCREHRHFGTLVAGSCSEDSIPRTFSVGVLV